MGNYSIVCRICRENGIMLPQKRNPNSFTKADKEAQKSENLIKQDFTAEMPNKKWISDITELAYFDGSLYVSPVLDCFDGAIVGLAMDDNMRKELCIKAFGQVCRRQSAYSMIFHSDRGSHYSSANLHASLSKHGTVQKMSGTGRCYDNARMGCYPSGGFAAIHPVLYFA